MEYVFCRQVLLTCPNAFVVLKIKISWFLIPDITALIDINYSNGFVPVIRKPTRITEHSKTLIDHIYTNTDLTTPNYKHKQGIIRTDISDHYPVFYLMLKPNENYYIAREINPTNIAQ